MNYRKNFDIFDVTKIILSIMVVTIHVNPLGRYGKMIYPMARIAVPLFFIMSSYLFFDKINKTKNQQSLRMTVGGGYAIRIFKLYLAWFIVLFPVILYKKHYFSGDILVGIGKMVTDFIFGSTFGASWYLSASVLGLAIVCILGRFFGDMVIMFVGGITYFICCMLSSYRYPIN